MNNLGQKKIKRVGNIKGRVKRGKMLGKYTWKIMEKKEMRWTEWEGERRLTEWEKEVKREMEEKREIESKNAKQT